ncbi:hypothetical protein EMOOHJMP_00057 [Microcystis phage MaAM05]|nr:hypothetical protein EMOOHJMP_00057 [Microcystis phage MaAM05]
MVYGGYGGYGGFGGYGGYGGLGSTPSFASGIHPPGSAPAADTYLGAGQQKPKRFLEGLFTGTWDGIRKLFTTVPGVLTTVGAIGLTVATGGAALIPLGALAAGVGIYNTAKGLINQDGQGFTQGLLLGLGGLLAIRCAPSKIVMNGRSFLLGGDAAKPLGFTGRLKTLWGGNHYVDSKGNASNWLKMSADKIKSQFRPNQGSLEHLQDLKNKVNGGVHQLDNVLDAEDALRAGLISDPVAASKVKRLIAAEQKDVLELKNLNRRLERRALAGKPTEDIEARIGELNRDRKQRLEAFQQPPVPLTTENLARHDVFQARSTGAASANAAGETASLSSHYKTAGSEGSGTSFSGITATSSGADSELGSVPGSPRRAKSLP